MITAYYRLIVIMLFQFWVGLFLLVSCPMCLIFGFTFAVSLIHLPVSCYPLVSNLLVIPQFVLSVFIPLVFQLNYVVSYCCLCVRFAGPLSFSIRLPGCQDSVFPLLLDFISHNKGFVFFFSSLSQKSAFGSSTFALLQKKCILK